MIDGINFTDEYHTFKIIWDPNQVVWFVDGVQRWRITETSKIPSEPMYIILNLAVGGNYPGSPDGTTRFPSRMFIDYVRVYRWE